MSDTSPYDAFADRLAALVTGDRYEIAVRDLRRYYFDEPFTGRWFEHFADSDEPNRITERDLVAVTMLGVDVPAPAAVWMLGEGALTISSLLERIGADVDIWQASDEQFSAAEELWDVLNDADWPAGTGRGNGMEPTIKSKVLAAKRPAMLPVIDGKVKAALGGVDSVWDAYRSSFSTPEMRLLLSLPAVSSAAPVPLLRAVDVIVWMAATHPCDGDPPAAVAQSVEPD